MKVCNFHFKYLRTIKHLRKQKA